MSGKEAINKLSDSIQKYIRPATFPVAVKFLKDGASFEGKHKKPVKDMGHKITLCQGVALARRLGWSVVFGEQDNECPVGSIVLGHKSPKRFFEGHIAYPFYAKDLKTAKTMESTSRFFPMGTVSELWIAPLDKAGFEPDLVLVYGNAAQVARIAQGANYSNGRGVDSKTFGRTACGKYLSKAYLDNECTLVVPSGGERVFANTTDDELIFSIPADRFEDVATGIEAVHKQGLSRYPTYFYGIGVKPAFPPKYYTLFDEE